MHPVRPDDRVADIGDVGSLLACSHGDLDVGGISLVGYGKSAKTPLLFEHAGKMYRQDPEVGARQDHQKLRLDIKGHPVRGGGVRAVGHPALARRAVRASTPLERT